MSDENVGGLVELPDRVLAFLSQHGGWDAALAYVHKIEVENRLRANAVDRWVPCPDHRDKTERGKCYVCENERLTKSLSAHGQPVVWINPDDLANPHFVSVNAAKEGHEDKGRHYTLPLFAHGQPVVDAVPPEAVEVEGTTLLAGAVKLGDWAIPTRCGARIVDARMAYGWNECRKAMLEAIAAQGATP